MLRVRRSNECIRRGGWITERTRLIRWTHGWTHGNWTLRHDLIWRSRIWLNGWRIVGHVEMRLRGGSLLLRWVEGIRFRHGRRFCGRLCNWLDWHREEAVKHECILRYVQRCCNQWSGARLRTA